MTHSASPGALGGGDGRGGALDVPLQFVKGVGPRLAALFGRLGVATVGDALAFFPRSYDDRRDIRAIRQLVIGAPGTAAGEVTGCRVIRTPRRRARILEVTLTDASGTLNGVWFHFRESYREQFPLGRRLLLHGEVRWDGTRLVMYHPEVEEMPAGGGESLHVGRIVPLYHLTEGLGQRMARKVLHEVARHYAPLVEDHLPDVLRERYHLPGLAESLAAVHFPPPAADPAALNDQRSPWHKRLVFEEFFFLELTLLRRRAERERQKRVHPLRDNPEAVHGFLERLPFRLTGAQQRSWEEIRADLLGGHPMYRLLQGDVGSGKTVVTALAALLAADNGFQTAIMAPTEILARQHRQTLSRLFAGLPVETVLLVNGLPQPERREAQARIADGRAQVAVGTHALIQEGVVFHRLGLAVIDEQHRFGVGHRLTLQEKGDHPDTLVVTATPIPRSLAMTLYGDMDISVIEELPPGRLPVVTRVVEEEELDAVHRTVAAELEKGHQAFIIYPLVEESGRSELKAVKEMAVRLAGRFPGHRVGAIHGRLKAAQKEAVMEEFRDGSIGLLVSTTVVEVGVDIPRATVMVVEHAERFGLAQLHQLRGRVGRGGLPAFCFLVSSAGAGEEARRRLEIMARTTDGFRLAEADLEERGPGEFAGLRQSGAPDFLLANLIRHRKALEYARQEAAAALEGKLVDTKELTILLSWANIKWQARASYLSSG